MRDLTFICAFFENQGMLREQQRVWRSYAPAIRARFHVIVTDDASPTPAKAVYEPVDVASYRLFRALEKRRWNWLFGRNLGADQAATDWILLTDIDHVLPESTLLALLAGRPLEGELEDRDSDKRPGARVKGVLDAAYIYRFSRVDAHTPWPWKKHDLTPYKPHPNSWLMTRAMFDRMGGYDERFSGFYGSDSDFRERCKMTPLNAATLPATGVIRLDLPLVRYPRETIADASTVSFKRKAKEDGIHVPRIKAERAQIAGWRPLRVTLPWTLELAS